MSDRCSTICPNISNRHITTPLTHLSSSNLPHILALHLGPLHLPLVPQHGKQRVAHNDRQAQAPDQGDGVEEVGVAGAGVDPEVIEGGAEEGSVEEGAG